MRRRRRTACRPDMIETCIEMGKPFLAFSPFNFRAQTENIERSPKNTTEPYFANQYMVNLNECVPTLQRNTSNFIGQLPCSLPGLYFIILLLGHSIVLFCIVDFNEKLWPNYLAEFLRNFDRSIEPNSKTNLAIIT